MGRQTRASQFGPVRNIIGNVFELGALPSYSRPTEQKVMRQSALNAARVAALMAELATEVERYNRLRQMDEGMTDIIASTRAFAAKVEQVGSTLTASLSADHHSLGPVGKKIEVDGP